MVGAMPAYAASSDKKDNDDKLYKEETVYVNADAAGNTDESYCIQLAEKFRMMYPEN